MKLLTVNGLESLRDLPICARCGVGRREARRMEYRCSDGWYTKKPRRHIWDWKLKAEGD